MRLSNRTRALDATDAALPGGAAGPAPAPLAELCARARCRLGVVGPFDGDTLREVGFTGALCHSST